MSEYTRLLTDKGDLGSTRLETGPVPQAGPGEIVLKLDRFSLTTNNITYAAFGDAMQYWHFFPTGQEGWGHMPVWGFADIVASDIPGLEVGERFYGYFPIASHVVMKPERISERGFYDGAEHRQALVSAYNQYTRCSADTVYAPEREAFQALYRPLFITSFMLADYLVDNDFFGARQLIISSASSKTAYGTAFCLGADRIQATGLTSPRNAAYVEGLGCYDGVVAYGDVESLDAGTPAIYVDFSGDNGLRERIHRHFGDNLVHDCFAGSAANTDFIGEQDLPGPKPVFYFAPNQIKKRNKDWGPAEVTRRYNQAESDFFAHLDSASPAWVSLDEARGFAGAQAVIADLAANGGDPATGHVIVL